jgi:hypothetical protein
MKKLFLAFLSIMSLTLLSHAQGQWEIGAHDSSRGSGFLNSDQRDYVSDAFDGSFSPKPEQAAPPGDRWAAQTSPTAVTLTWARLSNVAEYRIYEAEGSAFRLLGKARPSGDRYIVTIKPPWGVRRFAVDAVFEDGTTSEKGLFNEIRTEATTPGPVDPPASVAAEQTGPGEITVTWPAVPGATAYQVGRAVQPAGFQMLCSLYPTTDSYVDRAATPGAKHTYSVVALAPRGASRRVLSNVVTVSGEPTAAREAPSPAQAPPAGPGARGFRAEPRPGACLSLGLEGNLLVCLADGTVQFYERMRVGKKGMDVVPSPAFRRVAGISDAVAVATSGTHSLVLRRDGTVLAWGENTHGQIGSERAIQRKFGRAFPAPTEIPLPVDGIAGAVAIAAGHTHSVALLADGTIRTWGIGERGIPGDGRMDVTTDRLSPAVVAGIDNAITIAANSLHTFALLADKTVRGWGSGLGAPGFYGVLGTGQDGDSAVPAPVALGAKAAAIATGVNSGVVLLVDGTVQAWGTPTGFTDSGGDRWMNSNVPVPVPEVRDAIAVSPFLFLLADGTVRTIERPGIPVPGVARAVAVASDHVNRYALLEDGRLVGWGHPRWWPKGVTEIANLGGDTARAFAARAPQR